MLLASGGRLVVLASAQLDAQSSSEYRPAHVGFEVVGTFALAGMQESRSEDGSQDLMSAFELSVAAGRVVLAYFEVPVDTADAEPEFVQFGRLGADTQFELEFEMAHRTSVASAAAVVAVVVVDVAVVERNMRFA